MTKTKTKGASSNGRMPVSKTGNAGSSPAASSNKPGRPSKYTPDLVETICERLAKGEFLAVICRDDGMPDPSTVWDWQQGETEQAKSISQRVARAREEGFDALAREALAIADDGTRDYVAEDGTFLVNHDHIQRSKLRVDTRLKLLAKWDPKRYGDKVQLADNEGGKLPPSQTVCVIKLVGVGTDGS